MSSAERSNRGPWELLDSVRRFFAVEVWRPALAELPRKKAALYRVGRILYSTVRGFWEDRLTFRAAALTYYSILSIVPFLAFAFAVLKGFGAYDTFFKNVVSPYVEENFAENPALERAISQVFAFVAKTDVSGLGATGLLLLAYSSVGLLGTVESVLNELWGFTKSRSFFRRMTDYITLLVITPLLVLVAVTFGTAAQSSSVVIFLREKLELGPVIDFMLRFTSLAGACLAMTALFIIMPYGRVRRLSALLGGVVAGLLWQIALILHVDLQVGVAKYNALYSGFGALPIFLVWVYVSWLMVLLGAELAASHQNEQVLRQRLRARDINQAMKEALALTIMARAARAFVDGAERPSAATVAAELGAPPQTTSEIVDALVDAGLLATTAGEEQPTFLPAKDVDAVRVNDVLATLRHHTQCPPMPTRSTAVMIDASVRDVLDGLAEATRAAGHNITLRALAVRIRPPEEAVPAERVAEEPPAQERSEGPDDAR